MTSSNIFGLKFGVTFWGIFFICLPIQKKLAIYMQIYETDQYYTIITLTRIIPSVHYMLLFDSFIIFNENEIYNNE